jgi:hypothetical protein
MAVVARGITSLAVEVDCDKMAMVRVSILILVRNFD